MVRPRDCRYSRSAGPRRNLLRKADRPNRSKTVSRSRIGELMEYSRAQSTYWN